MVLGFVFYAGLVILSGLGVLWGVGSILTGVDRYRENAAIRDTPVAKLDSVAVGPSAVRGTIEPVGRPEKRLCSWDVAVAYELSVTDHGSTDSRTPLDHSHTVPFDIVTDAGAVRVSDDDFEYLVSEAREWRCERESYETPDEAVWQFDQDWNLSELRKGDERRYESTVLCPGDEVYAYGTIEIDETRTEDVDKPVRLTDRDGLFFISDRDPDELRRERRFAFAKEGVLGITVGTASLAAFLWLTGIAQVFLGA